jgi:hypothetical protein
LRTVFRPDRALKNRLGEYFGFGFIMQEKGLCWRRIWSIPTKHVRASKKRTSLIDKKVIAKNG